MEKSLVIDTVKMRVVVILWTINVVVFSSVAQDEINPSIGSTDLENVRMKDMVSADHIVEDLTHQINTKSKEEMTQKELQFYYFKLHDYDGNNLLDGLEIIKAIGHNHDEQEKVAEEGKEPARESEEHLQQIVDDILSKEDLNGDGQVSFHEFMTATGNDD